MDADRFDTLARMLTAPGSRRRALAVALAGVLGGVLGASSPGDAAAKKRACPPCKKRKQGKCKKKLPDGTSCGSGKTCQSGSCVMEARPLPQCANGVTDGGESDVDCGGNCSRCADGRICLDRDDCASAHCVLTGPNGLKRCQECTGIGGASPCASDAEGNPCTCDTTVTGQKVCNPASPETPVSKCADCPEGTNCVDVDPNDNLVQCFRPCAA